MQVVALAALVLSLLELSSAACRATIAEGALPPRGRAASRLAAATPLLRAETSRSPSPDPGDRDSSADSRRRFRLCLDEDSAVAETRASDFPLRK